MAGNLVTNNSSSSSDVRYKRNFSSIENPLAKVLQMNGFHYYWKQEEFKEKNFPESRQIGFIAQEVEALFPELVNTDEKGYKSVDYARLTPVLVEAIKELKKENNSIRTENADIRKDIEALKNLILQSQNGK
ncbi:tail fiber domain-containing protein [Emticicia sp. C21]|uniref:tail fiber domain-containing protein n=1 Tax=Emticicia sp. C21 TaxID=2302915 RepID=UPI0038D4C8BD